MCIRDSATTDYSEESRKISALANRASALGIKLDVTNISLSHSHNPKSQSVKKQKAATDCLNNQEREQQLPPGGYLSEPAPVQYGIISEGEEQRVPYGALESNNSGPVDNTIYGEINFAEDPYPITERLDNRPSLLESLRISRQQQTSSTASANLNMFKDPMAIALWKEFGGGARFFVPWKVFIRAFSKRLGVVLSESNENMLKMVLDFSDSGGVTAYKFSEFLKGFGPFEKCLGNLRSVLSQPWFKSFLSREEAERLLYGEPVGTFLVRFSKSHTGSYALGLVRGDGSVVHILVESAFPEPGLKVEEREPTRTIVRTFDSIINVVEKYQSILGNPLECDFLAQSWFHGDLTAQESFELLSEQQIGTYLVRFSTRRGMFSSSWVANDGQVHHSRLVKRSTGRLEEESTGRGWASLTEMVEDLRDILVYPYGNARSFAVGTEDQQPNVISNTNGGYASFDPSLVLNKKRSPSPKRDEPVIGTNSQGYSSFDPKALANRQNRRNDEHLPSTEKNTKSSVIGSSPSSSGYSSFYAARAQASPKSDRATDSAYTVIGSTGYGSFSPADYTQKQTPVAHNPSTGGYSTIATAQKKKKQTQNTPVEESNSSGYSSFVPVPQNSGTKQAEVIGEGGSTGYASILGVGQQLPTQKAPVIGDAGSNGYGSFIPVPQNTKQAKGIPVQPQQKDEDPAIGQTGSTGYSSFMPKTASPEPAHKIDLASSYAVLESDTSRKQNAIGSPGFSGYASLSSDRKEKTGKFRFGRKREDAPKRKRRFLAGTRGT
eukprot:TRINITY_DN1313_c0_g1_i1.p1 TRINITY_DN1313_c0_g1~~TRINITY_DN1313_c0_g1_i1.p1  ORF type:complete len:777 (-),score=129.97 TRINITY_DN1313_c0_g1_i1:76-2406(-)